MCVIFGGDEVASKMARLTPDQAFRVRDLAETLCSWSIHLTLNASLHPSIQMGTGELMLGVTL